jgi:hypothetical protein
MPVIDRLKIFWMKVISMAILQVADYEFLKEIKYVELEE